MRYNKEIISDYLNVNNIIDEYVERVAYNVNDIDEYLKTNNVEIFAITYNNHNMLIFFTGQNKKLISTCPLVIELNDIENYLKNLRNNKLNNILNE